MSDVAEGLRYVGDEGTLSWYVLRLANRVAAWVSVDNADPHRAVWAYDARRETAVDLGFNAVVVLTAVSVGPDPADVEVREQISGDHLRAVLYPTLPYVLTALYVPPTVGDHDTNVVLDRVTS